MAFSLKTWQQQNSDIQAAQNRRDEAQRQVQAMGDVKRVARRTAEIRRRYPTLAPGLIYPLATTRLSLDEAAVVNVANRDFLKRAASGNWANIGEEEQGAAAVQSIKAAKRAQGPLPFATNAGQAQAQNQLRPDGSSFLGDIWNAPGNLANPQSAGQAQASTGKVADDVLGGLPGYDTVRGVARAGMIALDTPMSYVNATIRDAASGNAQALGGTQLLDQTTRLGGQTQGGQAASDLIAGRRVDVGSGWFPDTESGTAKRAAEEARKAAPMIGGHAFTLGRYVANQVFAPDTVPFDILSGVTDAAVTIAADPLNPAFKAYTDARRESRVADFLTPADEAYDAATAARTAQREARTAHFAANREYGSIQRQAEAAGLAGASPDEWAPALTAAEARRAETRTALDAATTARGETLLDATEAMGGFGKGRFPWLSRKNVVEGFATRQGQAILDYHTKAAENYDRLFQRAVDAMAENAGDARVRGLLGDAERYADTAMYDSWLRYGKKGPLDFHRSLVTDAKNRGDVLSIFDDNLGTTLREFPVAKKLRPGYVPATDNYRWAQKLPGREPIVIDDLERSAKNNDLWLRNAQVPREERARMFGQIARAESRADLYKVASDSHELVRARLVERYRVPEDVAKAATAIFGPENEANAAHYYDNLITGEAMAHPFMRLGADDVPLPGPHLESELLNTGISYADPKMIRKLMRRTGSFSQRMTARGVELADEASRKLAQARELEGSDAAAAMDLRREAKNLKSQANRVEKLGTAKDFADAATYGAVRMERGDIALEHTTVSLERAMNAWKTAKLIRPAWGLRIVAEGQARLWAYGLPNMYHNPIAALGVVAGADSDSRLGQFLSKLGNHPIHPEDNLGKALFKKAGNRVEEWFGSQFGKYGADAEGSRFVGGLDEEFGDALNSGPMRLYDDVGIFTKRGKGVHDPRDWKLVSQDDPQFASGLADELIRQRSSPSVRNVLAQDNPEIAKAWMADTADGKNVFLNRLRSEDEVYLSVTDPRARRVADLSPQEHRQLSDFYVETVLDRAKGATVNDPTLMGALRDGELAGLKLTAENRDQLATEIDRMMRTGLIDTPQSMRVPRLADQPEVAKRFGIQGVMFSLAGKPENYFDRSPTFRVLHWQRMEELAPALTAEAKAKLLLNAREANVPRTIMRRIASASPLAEEAGGLGLKEATKLANQYALQGTRDILYDLSSKSQFWDQLRLLFPFGEAFQEVMSRWAKILVDNPKVIRRLDQGMEGAREQGFFEKGPFGDEVFTYPGSQWITDKILGMPIPLQGSVSGLNLAGNGLPGMGPAAQISASFLIPNKPKWDGVRKIIFPYGDQSTGQPLDDLQHALIPTWLGHAMKYFQTPEGDRQFGNTVGYMMNYLASTGEYDLHGGKAAEEADRLLKDATGSAKTFALIRAAASAVSPSAPIPQWLILNPKNQLAEINVVREQYFKRVDKDGSNAAMQWMLDTYGAKNFLIPQGFTTANGILPKTEKQWAWVRDNSWASDLYPETFGLFAPIDKGGKFDITAYLRTEESGQRDRLSPRGRVELANSRLASFLWDKNTAKLPSTDKVDAWKRGYKTALMKDYPGYNPDGGGSKTGLRVLELERASKDERVDGEMRGALEEYFARRQQAQEISSKRNGNVNGWTSAKKTKDIRDWLRNSARVLIRRAPQFRAAWEDVLSREMSED